MADFAQAVGITELREGGYTHDLRDSGGETYRGVSRNNWPTWAGWRLIDESRASPDFPALLAANSQLQSLVVDFYRKNFWQYDGLQDQEVANKVFDLSVNVGMVHAVKILQNAVGVKDDGKYGPETERVSNLHPQGSLVCAIKIAAEQHYKLIVQSHPEDSVFLRGWLRRVDA